MDENQLKKTSASLMRDMEAIAAQMRELIVNMPPHDLLGYIYAQYMIKAMLDQDASQDDSQSDTLKDQNNENQFLLEYVHAVLASDVAPENVAFNEDCCAELFELSKELRNKAMLFAVCSSAPTKEGIFGTDTAEIELHAKTTWVTLRGSRYQVLEGEFYRYVLAPHNDVLREVYGVGADDIADGFQDMSNATRTGHANALQEIESQFKALQTLALEQDKSIKVIMESWVSSDAEQTLTVSRALDDMFRGGIANISRHTKLPSILLMDLAYQRGEETEFFSPGDFVGTPYRTLPARKKPLIQLGTDYYAVDPCFIRDSGYRALLYNLLLRKPDYKKSFENRQKIMSEAAFVDILSAQLPDASVFQEVYYKDPVSKQWSENDTLIIVDDVLFLVEAKSGAAATIASPALDFARHAQSVQDLVIKAYKQCERFFNYLGTADEVPLYNLVNGKYEECARIRRSDYRVMVPIGLTVESFSPFSAYCKELPQVAPLLGKHAFVSLSIDDLFVLKRLLPTPGQFAHYMEVRQALAGIRRSHLFDEIDHLGAYLTKNRVDLEIAEQLKNGKANMVIWEGMSDIIDRSFEGWDWGNRPFPTQTFPDETLKLLAVLDLTRERGWLAAESHIRNLGAEGRSNLADLLTNLRQTLDQHPVRYFTLGGEDESLFIWLQRSEHPIDWIKVNDKGSAAALAIKAPRAIGIMVKVNADSTYKSAQFFSVQVPKKRTKENAHIYEDAVQMAQPARVMNFNKQKKIISSAKTKKIGRNELCPCGSGIKFKRCHGR